MRKSLFRVDMLQGGIVRNLLLFALPIAIGTILQTLYSSADMAVVGQASRDGTAAVSAIGATTVVLSLFTNLFVGTATGSNVLVSYFIGARDPENVQKTVQTSIWGSLALGSVLAVLGWILSPFLLTLTDCPDDVFENATLYMRILCLSFPFSAVYNFAASILRGRGDSTRPLIVLAPVGYRLQR